LLQKNDKPRINYSPEDLSSLAEIDLGNYEIPFNTTVPMCEFDTMTQLIDFYDTLIEMEKEKSEDKKAAPRRVRDQDILLMSYNFHTKLWKISVLLEVKNNHSSLVKAVKEDPVLYYANTICGGRFVLATTNATNLEYVAETIERHKAGNT